MTVEARGAGFTSIATISLDTASSVPNKFIHLDNIITQHITLQRAGWGDGIELWPTDPPLPLIRQRERKKEKRQKKGYPESRPLLPKKVRGKSTIHRVYSTGPSSDDKMKWCRPLSFKRNHAWETNNNSSALGSCCSFRFQHSLNNLQCRFTTCCLNRLVVLL